MPEKALLDFIHAGALHGLANSFIAFGLTLLAHSINGICDTIDEHAQNECYYRQPTLYFTSSSLKLKFDRVTSPGKSSYEYGYVEKSLPAIGTLPMPYSSPSSLK